MNAAIRRRLLGEGAPFVGMSVAGRAFQIIALLALARSAPPADFGIYAYVQTAANLGLMIGLFNLPAVLNVVLAHDRARHHPIENALALAIGVAGAVLSIALAAAILVAGGLEHLVGGMAWSLFAAFVAVNALLLVFQAVLFARGSHLIVAGGNLVSGALQCSLILRLEPASLGAILQIMTASTGVSMLWFMAAGLRGGVLAERPSLVRLVRRFGQNWARLILRYSGMTLLAAALFTYATWLIQRTIIAAGGPAENAAYAIGQQFSNVVIFLPGIVAPIFIREIRTAEGPRRVGRVAILMAAAAALCAGGMALFWLLREPVLSLFPASYRIDPKIILLGLLAGSLAFVKAPISVYFQAELDARPDAAANVLTAVLIVVLGAATTIATTAEGGTVLRAAAWAVQLVVVAGVLVWSAPKPRRPGKPQSGTLVRHD